MAAAAPLVQIPSDRLEVKLRRELGPMVLRHLADERMEDVALNADGRLWVKRLGERFEYAGTMSSSQAMSALCTVAAIHGTVINHDHPILSTELPLDDHGCRFEAIIAPVTHGPVFSIRLHPKRIYSLEEYESAGILTHKEDPLNVPRHRESFIDAVKDARVHSEVIRAAIQYKQNILVVGAPGSGKTTLANTLLAELARLAPDDRVVLIEDTRELQSSVWNSVELHTVESGEHQVSMLECLKSSLRLRAKRIIVGEVRDKAAHALLKAWNTGHPGGIATVHAHSAQAGLKRLESLVGEATESDQRDLIAQTINVVVFVDEEPGIPAGRKIREVALVTGHQNGLYVIEQV